MDNEPRYTSDSVRNDLEGVLDYRARNKKIERAWRPHELDDADLFGLDGLEKTIGVWAEITFPHHTAESHILHLKEQVDQLDTALHTPNEGERIADLVILCLSLAYHQGITLSIALTSKHKLNTYRLWGEVDKTGLSHHVEHVFE